MFVKFHTLLLCECTLVCFRHNTAAFWVLGISFRRHPGCCAHIKKRVCCTLCTYVKQICLRQSSSDRRWIY
uniref:Secreted protein n=1 Tax=Octopus bimaculoides TaxID=37653 RepID=A0A0L8IHK3_OCTBM